MIPSNDTFNCTYDAKALFNIDFPHPLPGFKETSDSVPEIDTEYCFDPLVTQVLLTGLVFNKRVLVHGTHGTGKSTHIEQICARLNIPCIRINFDGQISRADLIGRDAITLQNGQQVTEFKEGIIPQALRRPCVLVFDEYDAGRPEVMFVIQRLLEDNGRLTLLEKSEIITPHPNFRIFATANTVGLGDNLGIYHGTRVLNQAQMDRWSLTVNLSFMKPEIEAEIIRNKVPELNTPEGIITIKKMVNLATMIRIAFANDEISGSISPRAVLAWAESSVLFDTIELAFRLSYLNRTDTIDHDKIAEFYQRCFGTELSVIDTVLTPDYTATA
ncbi:MAG: cobaltochelatase CobS [Alphaproteobacteria bacterium]|jgi:cobaltochelatase CobS